MLNIELQFKKDLTGIAGFPFGEKIFKEQVAPQLPGKICPMTIIFPKNIERVASSFVQGFFSDIINEVGYDEFDNVITIKADTDELAENIRGNIR